MIRHLLLLTCLASAAAVAASPLDPSDPTLVYSLVGTPETPRSSEGSFVTLKSGKIVFAFSQFIGGNSDFSPCRIMQIESTDQGKTWSEPTLLFEPAKGTMEMSVSFLRLASGKIACITLVKRGMMDCRPLLRMSSDEGATWSEPSSILAAPGYFVLNNDRVIQTKSGRLVMPLAWHRSLKTKDDGEFAVDLRAIDLWYYSDDEGKTWTESDNWWALPAVTKTGLQEPGVVELADGSLLSWARTDQGQQFGMRSRDNGKSWSAPEPLPLYSPAAPASIMRLPGSSDLLAINVDYSGQFPHLPTSETYRGRTPLVAAVSSDGGVTWRNTRLLEGTLRRSYAYPAIHFAGEFALISYTGWADRADSVSDMRIRRVPLARLKVADDEWSKRSRAALNDIMASEENWIKIHAAEALIAGGEGETVKARFLKLVPTVDTLPYRVGVWRVLAGTARTFAERSQYVKQVEKIFLDPKSPDRSQALETLGKLRHVVEGPVRAEVEKFAADRTSPLYGLALWTLSLAGDNASRDALVALLQAPEERPRLVAAYALRWLNLSEPAVRAALARAADAEPAASSSRAYLLSAAFATNADPARRAAWREQLNAILEKGTESERFEASQGLLESVGLSDRARVAPLLDSPEKDTRVGATLILLQAPLRN